jgi:nitrate reductase NapE component
MYRRNFSVDSGRFMGCAISAFVGWFLVAVSVLGAIGFVVYKTLTHFGIL